MLTYTGGHKVGKGTYWNVRTGRRVEIAEEAVLPGGEAARYVRLPVGVMLLSGPIIGLLYVVFLPFMGIVMVAIALGREILAGVISLFGKSISYDWRPQNAYLAGKKKEKTKKKEQKK